MVLYFVLVMKMKGWHNGRNNQLVLFNFCSIALITYTGNKLLTLSLALSNPGNGKLFSTIFFGRTFLLHKTQWIATLKI